MMSKAFLAGSAAALMLTAFESKAASIPTKVGTCAQTAITRIGTRFSEKLIKPKSSDMDEGTSVLLANGVYGVSYQYVDAVGQSRIGDKVLTCLASIPKGCPKGDDRGKMYTTTNLRTQESWTLPDAQHMCGGA